MTQEERNTIMEGSAREKAIAICKGWDAKYRHEPVMTDEDIHEILMSLHDEEEENLVNTLLEGYRYIKSMYFRLRAIYNEYCFDLLNIEKCTMSLENNIQVKNTFNRILFTLEEDHADAKVMEDVKRLLVGETGLFRFSTAHINEDGLFEYSDSSIVQKMRDMGSVAEETLTRAKALIMPIEEYVTEKGLSDVVPEMVESIIADFKKDCATNILYSKREFIRQNGKESDKPNLCAIYPDYDSIEPDADMYRTFRKNLFER